MKRLSWKYIAGLSDAESCIDFQCHVDQRDKEPRLYIVPRLRIAMTVVAKDVLEMLKANHGGNIWECKRNHHNPNWQPALYWQLQGKQLRPFLQNIVNHLVIKQEQAKLCIWWIDRCMGRPFNKLRSTNPNGTSVESIRQGVRDELKAMKADPHRLSGKAIEKFMKLIEPFDGCDSRANVS